MHQAARPGIADGDGIARGLACGDRNLVGGLFERQSAARHQRRTVAVAELELCRATGIRDTGDLEVLRQLDRCDVLQRPRGIGPDHAAGAVQNGAADTDVDLIIDDAAAGHGAQ